MSEDTIHEFNDEHPFNDFIKNNEYVVIFFTATWSGPSKMISPIFTKLSKNHPEVKFVKLDIDELKELSQTYDAKNLPTFKLLHNSAVVDGCVGANPSELVSKVEKLSDQASANK
ncbi:thioredoxin trx1 [Coemansia sp. RSA 1822]|nr:thioredoxin trx1 [Coemansia sp. RSA 638]KAJ2565318.1 thioredoxin trx1 [Coemansia sp. RSA 1822]